MTLAHALGFWISELVHIFSIFSLDVSYTIFFIMQVMSLSTKEYFNNNPDRIIFYLNCCLDILLYLRRLHALFKRNVEETSSEKIEKI